MQFKLLTIDVWDTLLRRRCHPDEVKLFTCRWMLDNWWERVPPESRSSWQLLKLRQDCEAEVGRKNALQGTDPEYWAGDVFELMGMKVFGFNPDNRKKFAIEAEKKEIEQEQKVLYFDEMIGARIEAVDADKKVFLSDFYHHSGQVAKLLKPKWNLWGVVSCDVNLAKHSGRLFKDIQRSQNILPSEHCHIGDNRHSDFNIPKNLGMEAILWYNPVEEYKRIELTKSWLSRL